LLIYNLKLELFINITVVYFVALLTDFSYTNFAVSYIDALDRLRVQLKIILFYAFLSKKNVSSAGYVYLIAVHDDK